MKNKESLVMIFKFSKVLKGEGLERVKNDIKQQIKDGIVVLDIGDSVESPPYGGIGN